MTGAAAVFFLTLATAAALLAGELRETAVVRAVKRVNPAVVNISSEYEITEQINPFFSRGLDPFFDSFFRDFFEPRYRRRYHGTSLGSGVIVDGKRGYILTNEHVIAKSSRIRVVLQNESAFQAELVGAAPDFDLAVLKIDSNDPLPDIQMGDSDDIMIGETVIAIGNPFGFSHTVTTGVVSALHRAVQAQGRVYRDFIQTDASINPGNSGGPLLNINGDLIGINTAIYSKAQGIGFAIPINKAKRVMEDLIKYGEVHAAWIGLVVQDLDPSLTRYFRVPRGQGVLVSAVMRASPAQEAGLQDGDIIIAVGKNRIATAQEYYTQIRGVTAGDVVLLVTWENGRTHTYDVTCKDFPESLAEAWAYTCLGVKVADMTPRLRLAYGIDATPGVVVTALRPGCYLERVGLRAGDVIRKMNDVNITGVKSFKKAVVKFRLRNPAVLVVQRGPRQYYISVKLGA